MLGGGSRRARDGFKIQLPITSLNAMDAFDVCGE